MLKKLYDRLIELHPDHLIRVVVHYSPGVPGSPSTKGYTALVQINGTLTYPTSEHEPPHAYDPEEALRQLYDMLK